MIEKVRAKNTKALSDLYDTNAPALYGIILRIIKSESKAEVILEETFLKVISEIENYNPTTTFFTWMCSIARNLASKENEELPVSEKNTREEILIAGQLLTKEGIDLMSDMEAQFKAILDHVYIQGHSLKQTSKLLGITFEQTKIQFKLACDYLNKKYQPGNKVLVITTWIVLLIHL